MGGHCDTNNAVEHGLQFKHGPLAQFCYFVLGAGFLTGWNAFLTASDYFNAVFPGRSVDRVFTVTYLPVTLCLIGVVSKFPRLLWSGPSRVLVGYTLFTVSCAAIPVIDVLLVQPGHSEAAYALVLLAVALTAISDGITQPTVYADAALLPDKYTQCVVMGAAASGVAIGILRLVTKGALPQTAAGLQSSTHIYFAASAALTAASLLLYQLVMPKLDVVKHYRAKLAEEQAAADLVARQLSEANCGSPVSRDSCLSISVSSPERYQDQDVPGVQRRLSGSTMSPRCSSSAASTNKDVEAATSPTTLTRPTPTTPLPGPMCTSHLSSSPPAAAAAADRVADAVDTCTATRRCRHIQTQLLDCKDTTPQQQQLEQPAGAAAGKDDDDRETLGALSWMNILRLNWRLSVAAFMVYCITLSIFPGFLAENVHSAVLKDWYAVLLIFTFNVSDFLGRCAPEGRWHPRHITLLGMALSRLALIPLYAGLAVYGASEAAFFVLTFVLGLTNGWLTMLIFCAAPRGLSPSAAELAGMINVFAELGGLNAGAYLGWLWNIGKM